MPFKKTQLWFQDPRGPNRAPLPAERIAATDPGRAERDEPPARAEARSDDRAAPHAEPAPHADPVAHTAARSHRGATRIMSSYALLGTHPESIAREAQAHGHPAAPDVVSLDAQSSPSASVAPSVELRRYADAELASVTLPESATHKPTRIMPIEGLLADARQNAVELDPEPSHGEPGRREPEADQGESEADHGESEADHRQSHADEPRVGRLAALRRSLAEPKTRRIALGLCLLVAGGFVVLKRVPEAQPLRATGASASPAAGVQPHAAPNEPHAPAVSEPATLAAGAQATPEAPPARALERRANTRANATALSTERQAIDALATGDEARALQLYEALAAAQPEREVYQTALTILRARLAQAEP
jgi:hypothetical protein